MTSAASSFVTVFFPAMVASRLLSRAWRQPRGGREAFAVEATLPKIANRIGNRVMRIDEAALRAGISLPFGGSLVAVATAR